MQNRCSESPVHSGVALGSNEGMRSERSKVPGVCEGQNQQPTHLLARSCQSQAKICLPMWPRNPLPR